MIFTGSNNLQHSHMNNKQRESTYSLNKQPFPSLRFKKIDEIRIDDKSERGNIQGIKACSFEPILAWKHQKLEPKEKNKKDRGGFNPIEPGIGGDIETLRSPEIARVPCSKINHMNRDVADKRRIEGPIGILEGRHPESLEVRPRVSEDLGEKRLIILVFPF